MKTQSQIKITKQTLELVQRGGAVLASSWTSGSGRFISKRATPQYAIEINADLDISNLPPKSRNAVKAIIKAHPKAQKIIVINDWRMINKFQKQSDIA